MKRNYKKEKIGLTNINYQGVEFKIIDYIDKNHVLIEFQDEYKYKTWKQFTYFKTGRINNKFFKTVCNVGYIGYAKTKINNKQKQSYLFWKHMFARCYGTNKEKLFPSYKGCVVCNEWHSYETFEKWYEDNYYECNDEKMNLDKDILIKGNKIYSPDTCIFVPKRINLLFTKNNVRRGKEPIGVFYSKNIGEYKALCRIVENKSQVNLGRYKTVKEAFQAYKTFKESYIKQVADEYKNKYSNFPIKIYNAMYNYQVEITD